MNGQGGFGGNLNGQGGLQGGFFWVRYDPIELEIYISVIYL
jgi:hypothetical protein